MKKSIGKRTIVFPHPVFIIGTYDAQSQPNMMAVSWGGICCSDPPCIAISVRKARHTYDALMATNAFTVNIPPLRYIAEADYAGVASGKHENKFEATGLTPVHSGIANAPYIEEFPLSLLCKVVQINELGVHTQFIGEILDVIADEESLDENGLPDINSVQPFSYNSADKCYYSTGEKLMRGYTIKKMNR